MQPESYSFQGNPLERKNLLARTDSPKVLLAMPDSPDSEALILSLQASGMRVNKVNSGRDCVHIALASEPIRPYDLVIASLNLKDLDGVSLTLLLHDNGYTHPIATIAEKRFYLDEAYSREVGAIKHLYLRDSKLLNKILSLCVRNPERSLASAA